MNQTWAIIKAVSGIETVVQIGSLGIVISMLQSPSPLESNFKKYMGLPKTLKNVVVFLGNTLEENK